ncbi:hypothetical protein [Nocardioides sp. YIM 152315]|uniref:hypothetical protein n=1 Tax=Nocardioides sp. YIM 152315 TaxID=3031760 RepID=UPI0023DAC4D2|nr:hypothetical protein [Nocardioides sp. YIM 152315]MDF1603230.1 hypothetical protein [Nocardioides sp. YIM 152315]
MRSAVGRLQLLRGRLLRAYWLACARDTCHQLGLRPPTGIWFCARCELVLCDFDTFLAHTRRHVG